MKTTTYLFALLAAFIFASCSNVKDISIEKRHYRKGYYVNVRHDRPIEAQPAVVAENVNPEEQVAAVESNVETAAPVGEINAQPTRTAATSNSFAKEKPKHFSLAPSNKKETITSPAKKAVSNPGPGDATAAHDGDDEHAVALFLLIILAIILPPLAVLLADGLGFHFLIDLIFWLLSFGFILFIPGGGYVYLGIFGLIAIIYALFVIFEVI